MPLFDLQENIMKNRKLPAPLAPSDVDIKAAREERVKRYQEKNSYCNILSSCFGSCQTFFRWMAGYNYAQIIEDEESVPRKDASKKF